jgi:4a-hydroxytetrahydrobiopterin dehydratase
MSDLKSLNCEDLADDFKALNRSEIDQYLHQLSPPWDLIDTNRAIEHVFRFNNYYETMAFCNIAAQIAHQQDHHPVMTIEYNRCTIRYSTHSVDGLSLKDFICAAKTNAAMSL